MSNNFYEQLVNCDLVDAVFEVTEVDEPNHKLVNEIKRSLKMKAQTKSVSLIHVKIVEEAINKMRIAGCAYKIAMPDGTIHEHDPDNLFSAKPKRSRKPSKYPYGSLMQHFHPYIANLNVGDVGVVPISPFDGPTLLGSMSAWASKTWGNKSHQAVQNTNDNTVEIMRLK